ncbi:unnamed protein product [Closterium sp. Naga37s-1]|nr:unnamed protein product [Closterium sp. Naga37s-1]
MSIRTTSRLFSRVVLFGGAGAAAALAAYIHSTGHADPPKNLPKLADEVPSRQVQMSALAGSSSARPFDILVIGGGATGAGVALDAAARGLHVAMVERDDFSCGTSSRSTKLVHGGVRYLEKAFLRRDLAQLRLVNEALAERGTLIRNAPHLVWPLPTLTPCYHWWEVPYYWAGLKAYDLIAGKKVLYMSRVVTAAEATGMVPTLAHKARDGRTLKAGVLYYDGQMDDARLNLALATTAARAGAVVLNHASVSALKTDPTGRVEGAVVKDELTGKQVDVRAKVVVNATGAYCDSVRRMADPNTPLAVLASSGSHVVLPDFYLGAASGSTSGAGAGTASGSGGGGGNVGLLIPRTADGRVMFMLPWLGRVVAGTTDAPSEVVDVPVPTEKEVQFIVDTLSNYLDVDVRKEDVLSVWGGLRPLLRKGLKTKTPAQEGGKSEGGAAGEGKPEEVETEEGKQTEGSKADTSNVVREHTVMVEGGTLVTVTGGKWTTYRSMAEDTVNTAIRVGNLTAPTTTSPTNPSATTSTSTSSSGSSNALALPPSVTEHLPLTGAAGFTPALFSQLAQNADVLRVAPDRRILPYRLDSAVVYHLVRSYGTNASKVKEIATFAAFNYDASTELLATSARISFPDDLPLPEFLSAPSDIQLDVNSDVNVDEPPVDAFGNLEDLIVEESSSSAAAAAVAAGSLSADGADWILNLDLTDETSLIAEADLADELTAVDLTHGELTTTELAANDVNQNLETRSVKPDFVEGSRVIQESKLGDAYLDDVDFGDSGYTLGDVSDFLLDSLDASGDDVDFSSVGVAGDEFQELLVAPALANNVASQPEVTPQQGHVALPPPPPALQPMRISLLQLPLGLVLRRCGGSGTQIPSAPAALVAPAPVAPSAAPSAAVARSHERLNSDESPLKKRKRDLEFSPTVCGGFQQEQQQQPLQQQEQEQQQPSKVRRADPPSPASAVLAADEELEVDSGSEEGGLWEALEQQMKPATSDETPCQCLACQCKSEEDRMFLLTGKRTAKADAGAAGSKKRSGLKRKGRSLADGTGGDSMADVNEILGELAQIPLLLDLTDLPELPEGGFGECDIFWEGADVAVVGGGGDGGGCGLEEVEGKHCSGFGKRLSQMDVTEVVDQCRAWLHEALQSPGCDSIDVDFCLKVVGEVKGETVEGAKPMELVLEDGVPLECSIE